MAPADTVTILECTEDHRATKRIRLGPGATGTVIDGYDAGTWFMAAEMPVNSFDDLAALLEQHSANPKAFVIRGASSGAWSLEFPVRRTSISKPMQPAAFRPQPRRWLAIDMDKVPIPAGTDPVTDPDDAIEYLRGLLPDEFQEASCWWQFTSGQGFKGDTLNARLWFWLDRPLNDVQLRTWAREREHIDAALYNAAEPHYIAAPILGPGVRDPLPRRSGVYRGETDAVSLRLPEREEMAAREWTQRLAHKAGNCASAELAAMLAAIPNDDMHYDEWLSIAAKVKGAAGGAGEDAFVEWSARSKKHDDRTARLKYRSLEGRGGEYGLFFRAVESGYDTYAWSGAKAYPDRILANSRMKAAANANRPVLVCPAQAEDEDWWMPDPLPSEAQRIDAPAPVAALAFDPSVPLSSLLSALPPPVPKVTRPPLARYDLGGLGGAIADWLNATAIRPQPELSLLAALSLLSTLYGRRYRDERGTRPNLYTAGICDTGGGKDHARKGLNKLVEAAKQGSLMMGGKAFSGAGIMTALAKYPRRLGMLDEFGLKLKEISSNPGSGIKDKLMELYSSSGSVMRGDEYAEATKVRIDINEPSLSLYCTSTPEEFYSALSSDAVHNGLLNRFIILHACDNLPDERDGTDIEPPAGLVAEFVRHAMVLPSGCNLSGVHMADTSVKPSLMVVHRTPAAMALLRGVGGIQDAKISGDRVTGKLWSRLAENSTKVAMIRAISRDPEHPTVDDDDVRFGVDLVGRAIGDLAVEVQRYVADNAIEADVKLMLRFIQGGGPGGRTAAELSKNLHRIDRRRRREIIDDLVEAGSITETQERVPNARPRMRYRATGK
ncbi:PriCT-2 domain-containing protein [Azospirillum sp. B510]|uniref:PriCT-2 domain-containing protein n=1 Tax=Azospirillum sp. (strain B510) TaxID=137722 RepID=UPI0005A7F7AE|nr:PriCT-2 domain-containing protein [Azospirillum sp. B510]